LFTTGLVAVKKLLGHRPFKDGEMRESEKIQGAQCIAQTEAVWTFSLTEQIAVVGRPVSPAPDSTMMGVFVDEQA
jgi:hypothetical protein